MINITIYRDSKGSVSSFRVEGHSGYAPKGADIICSGVSALTQGAIYSLQRLLKIYPKIYMKDGKLGFALDSLLSEETYEKSALLLEGMVVGLEEIARSYPKYVKIKNCN